VYLKWLADTLSYRGGLLLDQPGKTRAAVESHYNWDRVAAETLEFVTQVTRRDGSSGIGRS